MELFDTHTHLYLSEFSAGDPTGSEKAVDRAVAAGVATMLMPNVGVDTIAPLKRLQQLRPGNVLMAMGLHPTEVGSDWQEQLEMIESELLSGEQYVAVGEIGVDLYWDKTFSDQQMQTFEHQLRIAQRLELPIVVHCRDALDQTLEVMSGFKNIRGVMHAFSGSEADVERVRRVADMYFGIGGVVTFKNSQLRNVLPAIGLDRILLETDSPYLAPVPMRGHRNESAYMVHTAQYVASQMEQPVDDIAQTTTASAKQLFIKENPSAV